MRALTAKAWNTLRNEGAKGFALRAWRKLCFWYEQARMPYVRSLEVGGGEILRLYVNTPFSRQWYTRSRAASPELRWIAGALRPGNVVADCGANNGFTGILFARAVAPHGKVVGFEPSPANLAAAHENIRLNGIANFELVAAAVGSTCARVAFDPGFGNGAVTAVAGGGTVEVPQVTLDAHFGSSRVDLIKIDVEGYELEVLRGARAVLQRRPALAIEVHVALYADPERRLAELFSLIDASAYDAVLQLEVDGPMTPFDAAVHTPALLARHPNVHWMGVPKGRAGQEPVSARAAADSSR